ncbi:MAG TPA: HK97 family phage prohead protease [Acidimicrobiia bacterium]|jgi:HK97 family phage prohead protease|nr:HK97 family phage prohead protease [Acidimicrobiia bacterium]
MTAPETRRFVTGLALRDIQAVGRPYKYLEGRAVPYDTWANPEGWFLEQHRYGSFKRSTNGRSGQKLPLLLFHNNRDFAIGHAESWSHSDDGLHGVWKLNESPEAQRAAQAAENGDLVGLSIGFSDAAPPVWEEGDPFSDDPDQLPRVTRVESRLVEVSMTPTPAFADAEVTMVRTQARRPVRPEREVDRWRRIAEELRCR